MSKHVLFGRSLHNLFTISETSFERVSQCLRARGLISNCVVVDDNEALFVRLGDTRASERTSERPAGGIIVVTFQGQVSTCRRRQLLLRLTAGQIRIDGTLKLQRTASGLIPP